MASVAPTPASLQVSVEGNSTTGRESSFHKPKGIDYFRPKKKARVRGEFSGARLPYHMNVKSNAKYSISMQTLLIDSNQLLHPFQVAIRHTSLPAMSKKASIPRLSGFQQTSTIL